jgi:hypothetical protein
VISRTVAVCLITRVVGVLCCKLNCQQFPQGCFQTATDLKSRGERNLNDPIGCTGSTIFARERALRVSQLAIRDEATCMLWSQRSPAHFRFSSESGRTD